MCRSAGKLFLFSLALLASVSLPSSLLTAQGVSVLNAGWEGADYVIRFSDSLDYTVDLAASDSMLVLNFSRPVQVNEGMVAGPNGIAAGFSRNAGDSMVVLTVRGQNRIEYSTLWRPYSHRLIVHTFDSDSLESQYAANRYHLGLLALEQGLEEQGRSYMSSALAFDNGEIARRASSVLGVMYARQGLDSLAGIYLNAPYDADDFMARAQVRRRAGDMEGAKQDEETFRSKIEDTGERIGTFAENRTPPAAGPADDDMREGRPPIAKIFDDWRGILLVGIAALLIIALAVWFSRRPVRPDTTASQDHPPAHPPAPTAPPAAPLPPQAVAERQAGSQTPAETIPEPQVSVMHSPEISAPATSTHDVIPPKEEAGQLPKPDALPDDASEVDVYRARAEAAGTEPQPQPTNVTTGRDSSRRGSAQADQLRQRMEAARSGVSQAPAAKPSAVQESVEHESTITEARRLNVSRDYVELRNRISELRKRIDES